MRARTPSSTGKMSSPKPRPRADEHRALAVEARDVRALVVGPRDIGDIADRHERAAFGAQRHAADFIETVERAGCLHIEAPPASFHRADRRIDALALQTRRRPR